VTELRKRTPEEFGLPRDYFLYIGRLAAEKNIGGLIAGWSAYRKAGGTFPLVLVGGGPMADALRKSAEESGYPQDVYFAGQQGSSQLPIYYAFAVCFALPSTREPWGLVVNEAMASKLPVLVSKRCGCAEDLVVPGRNGFLFDPSDQADLAAKLRAMEDMGSRGRSAMANYSAGLINAYSPFEFGRQIARISMSD
jgi:1,2-diacylglycerol 3-alpha-glucosyltransferase